MLVCAGSKWPNTSGMPDGWNTIQDTWSWPQERRWGHRNLRYTRPLAWWKQSSRKRTAPHRWEAEHDLSPFAGADRTRGAKRSKPVQRPSRQIGNLAWVTKVAT